MCGIAGMIDLSGKRQVRHDILTVMARSMTHRGPDEEGFLYRPGIGLASRRLSIVGLADGQQPISNEDGSVSVVYNGELFDYPEKRRALEGRGHHFKTHCDTELLPHLYEDHGADMPSQLRGQFAFCLLDEKKGELLLARDRFGICPLYWTRQRDAGGEWLLFASEIKVLLASGMVPRKPNPQGINHLFTFFALPGPATCFEGINLLTPGHCLRVSPWGNRGREPVIERTYWEIDFPDRGSEDPGTDQKKLVDEFESVFMGAVERRLRADVPVVSYLSGGVDSSIVVALASHIRKSPIPCFTIQIKDPKFDEVDEARIVANHIGADPIVVPCGPQDVLNNYPRLIWAAEGPVIDTSCTALLMLASEVHRQGYKVALTGEGSDEWMAGYPWYKVHKLLNAVDVIPGLPISRLARKAYLKLMRSPTVSWDYLRRQEALLGGKNAWLDIYGLIGLSKLRFFNQDLLGAVSTRLPYEDLNLNFERMGKWHPLNRSLYIGARVHLPGLLLNAKGDRVAMHSSVETRYPFLDEDVFDFLARVKPRLKMKGMRDKYLLRLLSERWLPKSIAWRRKAMFRAPFDSFHAKDTPPFVEQLLSEESLRKTGYFNIQAIAEARQSFRALMSGSPQRAWVEMGLVGIIATQLWYHLFIDNSLCDLPSWEAAANNYKENKPVRTPEPASVG
jgi:asparagine synthase (glutamine-hydrolysing)